MVDVSKRLKEAKGKVYRTKLYTVEEAFNILKSTTAVKFDETVESGLVYLLSDNREFHEDSRDFGPVPKESCTETIFFRLWGAEGWGDAETRMTYLH